MRHTARMGKGWVVALNAALLAQAAGYYSFSRKEHAPAIVPLDRFPLELGTWRATRAVSMDNESLEVLRPDDFLMRDYRDTAGAAANLFIAYFRTQRSDHAPHTPRNCLPGNGWVPNRSGTIRIPEMGKPSQIEVNRFAVARGGEKSIVLYWYLTSTRVIAGEYRARLQLILDSIRCNRSDTALIRVVVPVGAEGEAAAERSAVVFAQQVHAAVLRHVPVLF